MSEEQMKDAFKADMSIGERIDELGMELLATGFYFVSLYRSGKKPTKEMMDTQAQLQQEFKHLQATYMQMVRLGRIEKRPQNSDAFDRKMLDKIKEKQSTLGNIVAQRPSGG